MKYSYKILQLPHDDKIDYMFMRFEFAKKHGFNLRDYHEVYSGEIEGNPNSNNAVLEQLYYKFNVEHPSDFHGHSMSVSDIVVLDGVYYYCDSFGFVGIAYEEEK